MNNVKYIPNIAVTFKHPFKAEEGRVVPQINMQTFFKNTNVTKSSYDLVDEEFNFTFLTAWNFLVKNKLNTKTEFKTDYSHKGDNSPSMVVFPNTAKSKFDIAKFANSVNVYQDFDTVENEATYGNNLHFFVTENLHSEIKADLEPKNYYHIIEVKDESQVLPPDDTTTGILDTVLTTNKDFFKMLFNLPSGIYIKNVLNLPVDSAFSHNTIYGQNQYAGTTAMTVILSNNIEFTFTLVVNNIRRKK